MKKRSKCCRKGAVDKCSRSDRLRLCGVSYPTTPQHSPVVQDSAPRKRRIPSCSCPEFPGTSSQTVLHRSGSYMQGKIVSSSDDVFDLMKTSLSRRPQEEFWAIYMDNKNRVVGTAMVSRGSQVEAIVGPADVFRPALYSGATKVIVAHNHPSGDPAPSSSDAALTRRLVKAGEAIGILVLDSVVFGEDSYASLRNLGMGFER